MTIDSFTSMTKALADGNRVRMLMALRRGELCACQLIKLVGLAPSTVSKHMAILKQAGLVACRKEGKWMYYRLPGKWPDGATGRLAAFCLDILEHDNVIREDGRQLDAICKIELETLCRARRETGRIRGK